MRRSGLFFALLMILLVAGCSAVQDVQKQMETGVNTATKTVQDAKQKVDDVNKAASDLKTSLDNLNKWGETNNNQNNR